MVEKTGNWEVSRMSTTRMLENAGRAANVETSAPCRRRMRAERFEKRSDDEVSGSAEESEAEKSTVTWEFRFGLFGERLNIMATIKTVGR
jgi:hypothetical protein